MSTIGELYAGKPAMTFLLDTSNKCTIPSSLPAARILPFLLNAMQFILESYLPSLEAERFPTLVQLFMFQTDSWPVASSSASLPEVGGGDDDADDDRDDSGDTEGGGNGPGDCAGDARTASKPSEGQHFTLVMFMRVLWTFRSKTKRFESTLHAFTVPWSVPRNRSLCFLRSQSKDSTLIAFLIVAFRVLEFQALCGLHIRTVPSSDELATFSPSGENRQDVIGASCPANSKLKITSGPAGLPSFPAATVLDAWLPSAEPIEPLLSSPPFASPEMDDEQLS
mmetsp:Transcript_10920/g.27558  ORF Transcript_10920/g.27558 Transcript_10920/m.27558 type:complete len:281 (+) Transcript_10920:187-1029(+)